MNFTDLLLLPSNPPFVDTEHYPETSDSPPDLHFIKEGNESYFDIQLPLKLAETQPQKCQTSSEQALKPIFKQNDNRPEQLKDQNLPVRKTAKPKNEPEIFSVPSATREQVFRIIDSKEGNVFPEREQFDVKLMNKELWDKFSAVNTEMIVTKTGRRIFPQISLDVSGFSNDEMYSVYLYFKPMDQNTWKFSGGVWKTVGKNQPIERGE